MQTKITQISLMHNPNHCNSSGVCTELPVRSESITPQLLEDSRSVDGALELRLPGFGKFVATAGGFGGPVRHFLTVAGDDKEISVPLQPMVYTAVSIEPQRGPKRGAPLE